MLQRIQTFFENVKFVKKVSAKLEHKTNLTVKDVTDYIENVQYNLAVISIRDLLKTFEDEGCDKESFETFLKLLSPFCPYISEELWENLGNKSFISVAEWPKADEGKINEKFELAEKAVEQLSKDLVNLLNLVKQKGTVVKKAFVYALPQEKELYNAEILEKKAGVPVKVYAVNDKDKHDPQQKSGKAKPGKPGIYLE